MEQPSDYRTRPTVSILLLIVAAAHGTSLLADFLTDDYFNVQNALRAGWSWWGLTHGFTIDASQLNDGWQLPILSDTKVRYFRPLFLASLLVNHALWGLRPWGYHLTNILLHLGVVALFYGVLCELLDGQRAKAWFGALLYGVLPAHAMAVGWLSGRTELLPALAMMGSLWAYLRFAKTGNRVLQVASVAIAAAGLLAKENVVVFPLILLAAWLWAVPKPRPSAGSLLPYAALVLFYLPLRCWVLDGFPLPPPCFYYHSPTEPGFFWWALGKTVCVFYDLVFQLPLSYPIELVLARHRIAVLTLLAVAAAIALYLVRLIRADRDDLWRRMGYFAIAWTALTLLPTAPFLVAPFYFYFSLAGVCLLYLVIWDRLIERRRPRWLSLPLWRKAVPIVVAVLMTIRLETSNLILVLGSQLSRRVVDRLAAEVGEPLDGLRIYAVDLPVVTAWMKSALQLHWPGRRFEFHVLSVSPYFLPQGKLISRLEQVDQRTLRLTVRDRPYFSGVFGLIVFGDGNREAIAAGHIWPAPGYRVEIGQDEIFGPWRHKCVRQFVFHFDEPIASPRNLFLRFAGEEWERIALQ